jgi:prophage regulatory protein
MPTTTKTTTSTKKPARLLSRREVMDRVNLSYPSIWKMMRDGDFPRGRAIGNLKIVWVESELTEWIENLPVKVLKGDAEAA